MHIYGILNSNAGVNLSISKEFLLEENEPNEVYTISYKDISALVRGSKEFDIKVISKDLLARLILGQQTVIENIMSDQNTVIPVKLGTFAQNEKEVKDILNKGYSLIKKIFEKINNRIEIDITATWGDFASILKEAAEEREIREFKEKILLNPKGINADDQMKIGFMLKKELDKKRDAYACQIQEVLKTISPDFKVHEQMDDKMVVNIAFLVDKNKRESFDKKVEELNAKFNEKLNFRCVGPLPPYSFYTLETKKLKAEEIAWGKKRLGILNDIINKDELKKAYQKQALSTHPDKNPNNPCAEKEFNEVNKAYKIIADYCVALEQLCKTEQPNKVLFEKETYTNSLMLVRIRD